MNRITSFVLMLLVAQIIGVSHLPAADEPVFSGPQVGEKLTPFKTVALFGELAGRDLEPIQDWSKPTLLVFVHQLTRPSVAVVRVVMDYAAGRKEDGLQSALVFLGDDQTNLEDRVKRAVRALPADTSRISISPDGQEGPGSYGLNRDMTLTVLVAEQGRVTANFPIVQPTSAVDAPKIVEAITKVVGGTVPSARELGIVRYRRRTAANRKQENRPASPPRPARNAQDLSQDVQAKMRQLIQKSNSPEDVKTVKAELKAAMADDERTREAIGSIAWRVQNLGYGIPAAQQILKDWAEKYAPPDVKKTPPPEPKQKRDRN